MLDFIHIGNIHLSAADCSDVRGTHPTESPAQPTATSCDENLIGHPSPS
jgi:hypothetical protein